MVDFLATAYDTLGFHLDFLLGKKTSALILTIEIISRIPNHTLELLVDFLKALHMKCMTISFAYAKVINSYKLYITEGLT